jgi:hypothetical protein
VLPLAENEQRAKHVVLEMAHFRTRVQLPPPPPNETAFGRFFAVND